MKIDTLILSGGGIKCISFLGVLKYMIENQLVSSDFKEIINIICVSGSILVVLPLLLGMSIDVIIQLFIEIDLSNFIDFKDIKVDTFLTEFGLFSNNAIYQLINKIFSSLNIKETITLKELYGITNKNVVIKVVNISRGEAVYMNHENYPDLSVLKAIQMTTCIPFIFTPILYEDDYYIDGGVYGNFPIEYINEKYNIFGINIRSKQTKTEIHNIIDYILKLEKTVWKTINNFTYFENKRVIHLDIQGFPLHFEEDIQLKKDYINKGYLQIKEHFKKYGSEKHTDSSLDDSKD